VIRVLRRRRSAHPPFARFAPLPVQLPFSLPSVLAVGGELKSTICLARDDQASSASISADMENLETLEAFASVEHLQTRCFGYDRRGWSATCIRGISPVAGAREYALGAAFRCWKWQHTTRISPRDGRTRS